MGCAFFVLFVAALVVIGGIGVLVWFGGRRIARHLEVNPEAAKLLAEHVIMPLLVRKEAKPEAKKVKGFVV